MTYANISFEMISVFAIATFISLSSTVFYLHKDRTHNVIQLHKSLRLFFATWIWLTSGIHTEAWVSIHRDHHDYEGSNKDVHSLKRGFWHLAIFGLADYFKRETDLIQKGFDLRVYSYLERNVFFIYRKLGMIVFCFFAIVLLGIERGVALFLLQFFINTIFWSNIFNAISHTFGYPQTPSSTTSAKNIFPIGFLLLGEELHYNHHSNPGNISNRQRWYEFDFGSIILMILHMMCLVSYQKNSR